MRGDRGPSFACPPTAAGYVDPQRVAREVDTLDRIVATLYKLAYRAR
jgi:hypothetical protein